MTKQPRYVGDCLSDEMETPRKAKRNWHLAKEKINFQKKKIIRLQQQNRRLRARVVCLKSLLKHLKNLNLITENAHVAIDVS